MVLGDGPATSLVRPLAELRNVCRAMGPHGGNVLHTTRIKLNPFCSSKNFEHNALSFSSHTKEAAEIYEFLLADS